MPIISEHKEFGLRRTIRDTLAVDPLISMNGLQRAIEKKINRPIDEVYLKKLVKKVTAEMVIISDREKVEERVSYLRERNRIICEELFRMAFPAPTMIPQPDIQDRRKALEAIARIEANQVKLEMDLGLFTRKLGTFEVEHRLKPIDEKTLENIMNTFKVWAEPPQMRKIERREAIEVQIKETPHEPTNNTTTSTTATTAIIPIATGARMVPTE